MEPIFFAVHSNEKQWNIRVEGKHGGQGQKHIHISRKKLKGTYSWNIDGSRHDKSKFPKNEKMIGQAKKIASEKLNIDANKLQYITLPTYKYLLITFSENKSANYKMIFKNSDLILLYSSEWLIITSSDDSKNKAI